MKWHLVIKEIRTRLGLTQEELAHKLNVSVATVNRWENKKTVPSRLARDKLLDILKIQD